MTRPTILVTGAAGKTGGEVVTQLREAGWPVRAVVRSRDVRSERLDRLGAETVVADLFDPYQIAQVMRGTQRAYYCPPFDPYMIQRAAVFAAAARDARLESIVSLGQWLASPVHPSLSTRQHWIADRLFALPSGVAHTRVNPGLFAEYPYLRLMTYAAQLGLFPMPGDGAAQDAPPSNADIARVSVAALMHPERHAGQVYRPTGPTLLSLKDMAGILSRVLGRKVRHVNIPMWMFFKAVRMDGTSPILMDGLKYYVQEQIAGTFAAGAPTDHVSRVTGRAPESFETIARRHAALPEARRTAGNGLRTLARFLAVPFSPGFDPARFEREQFFPMPAKPLLDIANPKWRSEHEISTATARESPVGAREKLIASA